MGFTRLPMDRLPKSWKAAFFGDLIKFRIGRTPPRAQKEYWDSPAYPWVSISDMVPYGLIQHTAESVSEAAHKHVFRGALVPSGSTLMSFKLTIGRVAKLAIPAYHNEAIISFRADRPDVDGDFLGYYLSQINYAEYRDKAIKGDTLNSSKLRALEIALPPIDEQRQIAVVLSAVRRAIERQERLIALTAELKKALVSKLFSQGTRGEPLKQTEIGPLPASWRSDPLDQHLAAAQYGLSVKGADDGKVAILRMTNQVDGRIVADNMQMVNIDDDDRGKFIVEPLDILFNRTNSFELVGRTAIFDLPGDYVFASYLIRLRTRPGTLRARFLNHYLNWGATQARLKGIASRAVSQSNISASRLRGFVVPLPSPEEQDEIVRCIDAVDRVRSARLRQLMVFEGLFRMLLHQLMTAQIRVQDLDLSGLDESAAEPVETT